MNLQDVYWHQRYFRQCNLNGWKYSSAVCHSQNKSVSRSGRNGFWSLPQSMQSRFMLWAGISKRGATWICVRSNNGCTLVHTISRETSSALHWRGILWHRVLLHAGQYPKHTSHVAKAFYNEKWINWWPTAASSTDFNPNERVWREYFIAKIVKPLNKQELVEGICLFWRERMSPAKCIKYIDHTFAVLLKIVTKEGGITGEWQCPKHTVCVLCLSFLLILIVSASFSWCCILCFFELYLLTFISYLHQ